MLPCWGRPLFAERGKEDEREVNGMRLKIPYGRSTLSAEVSGDVEVVTSRPVAPLNDPAGAVRAGLERPIEAEPLSSIVRRRKARSACILVSDATRRVPGELILEPLLDRLQTAGIHPDRITILIATGLHRPTTREEKRRILGPVIPTRFRVVDHDARDEKALVKLPGKSPAGATVYLNRAYMEADLKLATGLIEPHFMLGYTGGRKAVCPGIADLRTVQRLHGPKLLSHPEARAGVLDGNPCHEEALGIARMAGVDLIVNVTLDQHGRVVGVYVGDLDAAHRLGVRELEMRLRLEVLTPADVVVTSAGGFPLDGTFYQAVKGFVAALEVVKPGGVVVCCAACSEGVGSDEYRDLMLRYRGDFRRFLRDLSRRRSVTRDQWQYQMHARVLERVGVEGLFCVTDGVEAGTLGDLSVSPPLGEGREMLQETLDAVLERFTDPHVVAIPEGPYVIVGLAT